MKALLAFLIVTSLSATTFSSVLGKMEVLADKYKCKEVNALFVKSFKDKTTSKYDYAENMVVFSCIGAAHEHMTKGNLLAANEFLNLIDSYGMNYGTRLTYLGLLSKLRCLQGDQEACTNSALIHGQQVFMYDTRMASLPDSTAMKEIKQLVENRNRLLRETIRLATLSCKAGKLVGCQVKKVYTTLGYITP